MQGLNKSLSKELNLPSISHDTVEKFSFDSNNQDCMNSECNNCKSQRKSASEACRTTLNFLEEMPVYVIVLCRTG